MTLKILVRVDSTGGSHRNLRLGGSDFKSSVDKEVQSDE